MKKPSDIPWAELQKLAKKHGQTHLVLLTHSAVNDQVVTVGGTHLEAAQAAAMGNKVKDYLQWPKELHAYPDRILKIVELWQKGDFKEQVGLLRDSAENFLSAGVLPVAPEIHVKGLTGGMEKLRDGLNELLAKLEAIES